MEFIGRKDHQIKIRGFLVEPAEVVAALLANPVVKDAVVIADEEKGGDKRLVAFAVAQNGDHAPEALEVLRDVGNRLPQFMVPTRLIWLDQIHLNTNNKVDRARLLKIAQTQPTPDQVSDLPRDELEDALAKIWCRLLQVPSCGIDDSFFDLGGDSLLMMQMAFHVNADRGVDIPLEIIFRSPTIRAIAGYLSLSDFGSSSQKSTSVEQADPLLVPLTAPGLRDNSNGRNAPSVFIVSGGGGHVQPFAAVGAALAPAWRVVGLLDPHFSESEPRPKSVEELASRYIRAAQTLEPTGPYYLVGYSFGGLVVHEMARQLQEQGFPAGSILLDRHLRLWRSPAQKAWQLLRVVKRSAKRVLNNVGRLKTEFSGQLRFGVGERIELLASPAFRRRMLANQRRIGRHYKARPSGAPTFVIRAEETRRSSFEEDYGWSAITPVAGILTVPGDHLNLFKGTNEKPFVAGLTEALETVREAISTDPLVPFQKRDPLTPWRPKPHPDIDNDSAAS